MQSFHSKSLGLSTLGTGVNTEASLGQGPGEKIANCVVVLNY
jgi:hypothetical protein